MLTDYSVLQTEPISKDPRFRDLSDNWRRLIAKYLPLEVDRDEFYSYNRVMCEDEPPQGWKLHISATILSACEVFSCIAPVLAESGVRFKAIKSLITLKRLNCGSFFGYQQIGKFVTVYPHNELEALALAEILNCLTVGMIGPAIPSDISYRQNSIVFYRYGAFRPLRNGSERCDAIRTPSGELVPDLREPGKVAPSWVTDPFQDAPRDNKNDTLKFGFLAYQTISQRGKGTVRRTLDLRISPVRLYILKEGLRWGEVDLDGRDGYSQLENEARILKQLGAMGLPVPQVHSEFRSGNGFFLVMEHIDGENLQTLLVTAEDQVKLDVALWISLQIALFMADLHHCGWAWRDCKPQNLILTKEGILRPIDFEDSARLNDANVPASGTRAYLPPEWPNTKDRVSQDLYALGVTFHQILTRTIRQSIKAPVETYRNDIPGVVQRLVGALLSNAPHERPSSRDVVDVLKKECAQQGVDIKCVRAFLEQSDAQVLA